MKHKIEMMKKFALIILIFSSLITSCDRDTLKGLNLKIDAEIKSDYDQETTVEEKKSISTENSTTKKTNTEDISSVKTRSNANTQNDDVDAPMPFKQINDCSEAGIRSKTNEIFYANNSQVKSIDSKSKEEVKKWKNIYQKVAESCN